MRLAHRPVLAVVTAICLSTSLGACTSKEKTTGSTASSSASSSSAATSSAKPDASSSTKLQPRKLRDSATAGTNPTIADYVRDQHVSETQIHRNDPGAPRIEIQFPDGWQNAGDDTPDYAYGALVYRGAGAADSGYTPNIIALVSRLEGPVDPDKLLQLAGGEMKNLPGFAPAGEENATVSGFPAYRIAGTYDLKGVKAASGQETVVFQGSGGLYVLQINGTSDQSQAQALFDGLEAIDKSIAINPDGQ